MGTKANSGKYDCYAKAADDEPIFTLRANNYLSPLLVRLWRDLYEMYSPIFDQAKSDEATQCALDMEAWRTKDRLAKSMLSNRPYLP